MGVSARVGVMGGTFDPIHIAHLIAAEEALARLNLKEVLFVPAGAPWHRGARRVTEAHHRLAMVSLSIASNPCFRLSTVDLDRPGPTYTVETLAALRQQMDADIQFYFILGIDSVVDLPKWKDPNALIHLCHLVAVPRPGYDTLDPSSLEPDIPGISAGLQVLPMPLVGISSTEIRQRVQAGLPIKYQVSEPVEAYIHQHGLYKGDL